MLRCKWSTAGAAVARAEGGAVWSFSSTASMVNCTLSRNIAGTSGGGMYNLGGGPMIANSICATSTAIRASWPMPAAVTAVGVGAPPVPP